MSQTTPTPPRRATDTDDSGVRKRRAERRAGARRGARALLYWLRLEAPIAALVVALFIVQAQSRMNSAHSATNANRTQTVTYRTNCRRGMRDRHGNAESWYAAGQARLTDSANATGVERKADLTAAHTYLANAREQEGHLSARYSLTYPQVPVGHVGTYPYGIGTFSCETAFPFPPPVTVSFWHAIFG